MIWRKSSLSGSGANCVELAWRKSSYSNASQANCVELAHQPAAMAVRDSKNPTGPRLSFPQTAFQTFLRAR
jgi:hypothetical protein